MSNFSISRREILKSLMLGTAAGSVLHTIPLQAAQQVANMDPNFVSLVRSCTPKESLFLHLGDGLGSMLELKDGSLLTVTMSGRSTSPDGGRTWSEPEPVRDLEGHELQGKVRHLLRLKSGGIGGFYGGQSDRNQKYGISPWFGRSDDEGKTWSKPVKVGEPYNNAVMHDAIVTSRGRIVVPVYKLLGKGIREKGKALFGDQVALVGHHGYELFFTYCWVYYSDDEGKTWHTNEGKGIWGAGGELFVTLDYSAGGHYRCNEPVVAEVSPDHLLMFLRTPLGRLYQSWSKDDGTSWSRPEPTTLASALAPAALERIPGSNDLLVIWNQSSADEIERGMQRHRLSSAISKDGGTTWKYGRNVFSIFQKEGDINHVQPPPIRPYRAMEHAPRLPPNDLEGTYPSVDFGKDRVIIRFTCRNRAFYLYDAEGKTGYDPPHLSAAERQRAEGVFSIPAKWASPSNLGKGRASVSTTACVGLPISWFYT